MTSNLNGARSGSRQRLWLIGAWTAILVVLALAGGVAGKLFQSERNLRELARVTAGNGLLALHWKALETQAEFQPVIDAMHRDFTGARQRWAVKIVDIAAPASSLDAFEQDAVRRIQEGAEEVWQATWSGGPRYARAVRAGESCLPCHFARRGTFIQPRDLIAIVSLTPAERLGGTVGIVASNSGRN
jgi:hypothetical protein